MVHLKKAFAGMRALDITPDRVRDYQAHRRAEDASPATVNRETSHPLGRFGSRSSLAC